MLRSAAVLTALFLGLSTAALAATPVLVRDLDPRPNGPDGRAAGQFTRFGSRAVFVRQDDNPIPASASELWISDGTAAGTEKLYTFPEHLRILGVAGDLAFFATVPAFSQTQTLRGALWRTDGTTAGTFALGPAMNSPRRDGTLSAAALGDGLLFEGCTDASGCEPWRSDGTPAGTRRLREVTPGPEGSDAHGFAVLGDLAYFFAKGPDGPGLWRSDGTPRGTRRVALLPPFTVPLQLTVQGSRLFFLEGPGIYSSGRSFNLWTTDGTTAGTRTVAPFDASRSTNPDVVFLVAQMGDLTFLMGHRGRGDYQLWVTDGDRRSARLTSFPALPQGGYLFPGPDEAAAVGGTLVFQGADSRLWTTRGTVASTRPLAGCPGGCPGVAAFGAQLLDGRLVFPAGTEIDDQALWSTNGTGAGTRKLRDLCPSDGCHSYPVIVAALPHRILFDLDDRLWSTDGTAAGTRPLPAGAIGPLLNYGDLWPVTVLGDHAVFSVGSRENGPEIWTTDGTPRGTSLLSRVGEGPGAYPRSLTPFRDGVLFFTCSGYDSSASAIPWYSDGTRDGTQPLATVKIKCEDARAQPAGDLALFVAQETWGDPYQVWRTDGTPAGTFPLTRLDWGESPQGLGSFRGKLVFTTYRSDGSRFWTSDGTPGGTSPWFDAPALGATELRAEGDGLFFLAETPDHYQPSLWRTDGTTRGTVQLPGMNTATGLIPFDGAFFAMASGTLAKTDGTPEGTRVILPNSSSPEPILEIKGLTSFAGSLFFFARFYDSQGRSVWFLYRSDGTAAGTLRVQGPQLTDLPYGAPQPVVAGGFLYFVAADEVHGQELWRTDGTAAGTVLIEDLLPGAGSSEPRDLTASGGRLFFTAGSGGPGRELWRTRGVPGDARRVATLPDGTDLAVAENLALSGDRIFFNGDDGVTGAELWLLPLTPEDP